jgi:hypothetical protein
VENHPDHCLSCPHPVIKQVKKEEYNNILQWISSPLIDTDLSFALSSFFKNIPWPRDWLLSLSISQQHSLRILSVVGFNNFLHGYIPVYLSAWQEFSFQENGSGLTGRRFASQLIRKLLVAKHTIWLTRCQIVHDRAIGGLYLEEKRFLRNAVKHEFQRGFEDIPLEDSHLTTFSEQELFSRTVDFVRGWLVDIYQSRGEFGKAQAELIRDRNSASRKRKLKTSDDIRAGLRKRVCLDCTQ